MRKKIKDFIASCNEKTTIIELEKVCANEKELKACTIIKKQEDVKNDISCLGIIDEWVKKLGIK